MPDEQPSVDGQVQVENQPAPAPAQSPEITADVIKEFLATEGGQEIAASLTEENLKRLLDQSRRFAERGEYDRIANPQLKSLLQTNKRALEVEMAKREEEARQQAWLSESKSWNSQQWAAYGQWLMQQQQTQQYVQPMVNQQVSMKLANMFDSLVERLPENLRSEVMDLAQEEVQSVVLQGGLPDDAIFSVIQGVTDYMADEGANDKMSQWKKDFIEKELPDILNSKFDALAAERLGIKVKSGDQSPASPPGEIYGGDEEAQRVLESNASSVAEKAKAFKSIYGFDIPSR